MTTPRFKDIKPYTRASSYAVDVPWTYIEQHLEQLGDTLDLDPDFQRIHVWDDTRRSRYIEHIMRGGRSARDLYFNCATWNSCKHPSAPIVLVDGKQRLEAVRQFLANKVQAFGHYFSEYGDKPNIITCSFRFHMNDLATRAEVLQWYLDINAGGVAHTEDEIAKVESMLKQEIAQPL